MSQKTMTRLNQASRNQLSDVLRWAVEASQDPAMAAADWLARDISPEHPSAVAMLVDPAISLEKLRNAKDVFKTMRLVGETAADRRLGATLYLGAIAAALVRHNQRISRQSPDAIRRGLKRLIDDDSMPEKLRNIAGLALCLVNDA
jgi:hypothetical protein